MEEISDRWRTLWQKILARFEEESGDPPESAPEDWELALLGRLLSEEFSDHRVVATQAKNALHRLQDTPTGSTTLGACEQQLRKIAMRAWASVAADSSLSVATRLERDGDLPEALAAYAKALALGPKKPLDTVMRMAQLQRVMGSQGGGGVAECEVSLRKALGADVLESKSGKPFSPSQRTLVTRLAVLLCQEGREQEALPFLQRGSWQYRLAPCVLHYPLASEGDPPGPSVPFLRVFDDWAPRPMHDHLKAVFARGSPFWHEHGYNEVVGNGENGYFSYLHPLGGAPCSSLDIIINHVLALLTPHFPELSEARFAEWWSHCRPHPCGHQMHFDSDNEGIGGARHPIVSSVFFVEAPKDFGGPTLITDQRLDTPGLASRGWLVHPRPGRLIAYEGSFFHGVLPGRGEAPESAHQNSRRITFMVAFWKNINGHAFGPDGLSGSSRPLPDVSKPVLIGPRTYTWQQRLGLKEASLLAADASPAPGNIVHLASTPVWTKVGEAGPAHAQMTLESGKMPSYEECFQF